MLYDPKWDKQTTVVHPSLPGLIAWLETKDPAGRYVFHNCDGGCLVSLYGASFNPVWNHSRDYLPACAAIFGGAGYEVGPASCRPHTFGAALERARHWSLPSTDGTKS